MEPITDNIINNITQNNMANLVFDTAGSYTRTCSVERDLLENKLKKLYGSQWCEITSSGINAIYCALFTIFKESTKKYVIVATELFGFTKSTLRLLSEIFNKEVLEFNYENSVQILELVKLHSNNICCMYFESCSNPSNLSIDWTILNQIKKISQDIKVVIDNTWLSPAKFNPFNYEVDIVIDSCTKYLSGGKCIAGSINFKNYDETAKRCSKYISLMGIHVSPIHCTIVLNMLESLNVRTKLASERAVVVAGALKTIECVKTINYNNILTPSVIRFSVECKYKITNAAILLENLCKKHNIDYSTSFGKPYDSIDSYPKVFEGRLYIRLAIGHIEDNGFLEKLRIFVCELSEICNK